MTVWLGQGKVGPLLSAAVLAAAPWAARAQEAGQAAAPEGEKRLDLRFGWRATDRVSLGIAGRNLLRSRHPEFGPIAFSRPAEVPRSVYVSIRVGY